MARPRKDQGCAEQRIIEAFWTVLETTPLRSISVRAIVDTAEVNRGTFYYYFADIDALIGRALEQEFLGENSIMHDLLLLVSGSIDQIPPEKFNRYLKKTAMFVRQGGGPRVSNAIVEKAERIWQATLCPNGEAVNQQTRMFIRYNMHGIIGLITSLAGEGETPALRDITDFQKWNAQRSLENICELQGIDKAVVLDRLSAALSLSRK